MEQIYKSKYQQIFWEDEFSLFDVLWTDEGEMTDEEYRREITFQAEKIEHFGAKLLLIDTRNFHFTILPETQEWTGQNIFPRVSAAGCRRVAILVPEDIFVQVSIEQNMEEDKDNLLNTKYFEDKQAAKEWLLSA